MVKHGLANEPSTSRVDINAAQVEELILGCWSNTWEVHDNEEKGWLFVLGYECHSLVSTTTKFLNSSHIGANVSLSWGIMLKNTDS